MGLEDAAPLPRLCVRSANAMRLRSLARPRLQTALCVAIAVSVLLGGNIARASAPVQTVSFLGGAAADEIRAGVLRSDRSIALAGRSASATVTAGATAAGGAEVRLEAGDGFVVTLDSAGTAVAQVLRLAPVAAMLEASGEELVVAAGQKVHGISLSKKAFSWSSDDLGATVAKLIRTSRGYVALVDKSIIAIDSSGKTQWSVNIGKSRVSAIAADATYVYAGGDQNTNTGQEPYRSPYVFRYEAASGAVSSGWKLYNWSGPDVRANARNLQADSFINQLRVDGAGKLWLSAGSDGGNSVLTRPSGNLDGVQSALAGACYDGPCFGYKGAKKTGMIASVAADIPDLERASWIIPYLKRPGPGARNTPACGCKSGPAEPNSMTIEDLAFAPDTVIAVATTTYRPPETDNGWYHDTVYQSGTTWLGFFDRGLRQLSMATMIPGTRGPAGAELRGGRLLVFGAAGDTSAVVPAAGEETWARSLPVTAPNGVIPVQPAYGGGTSDGYFMVACAGTDAECSAAPPPLVVPQPAGSPDGGSAGGGGPAGSVNGLDGGGPGSSADRAASASSGGCGCQGGTADPQGARDRAAYASFGLLLALSIRRKLLKS
jgi:hypothetical protein